MDLFVYEGLQRTGKSPSFTDSQARRDSVNRMPGSKMLLSGIYIPAGICALQADLVVGPTTPTALSVVQVKTCVQTGLFHATHPSIRAHTSLIRKRDPSSPLHVSRESEQLCTLILGGRTAPSYFLIRRSSDCSSNLVACGLHRWFATGPFPSPAIFFESSIHSRHGFSIVVFGFTRIAEIESTSQPQNGFSQR